MKIFIDWLKKAITKIEHDNELYVGNQFSNKFNVYFYNVGTDTDWFPTLTQLAPTGREAGPFSADSDSFTTTTIDNVTYLTVTFTMGTGYAFIKGVSSFFLYENRITTPNPTKSVIGKFIVTLNKSDNGYFLDDPEFNPKVKEYVDKYSQLRFGGEASTSVIEALETNQGVWLATDTGYYWYWDYDNNEYVRGNLFQAVSVADGAITTAKIADGAVTTAKIPQGAITDTKLAGPLALKITNSVQKGENNPTANSNVHTNIVNSNSMESDTDESYGSQIDLSLDKAIVGHSTYSNSTTKYSKVEFDEYHDNTDNDDYPRTVIETKYEYDSTPETSKITILKDLIELISGGKISIKKGNSEIRIFADGNSGKDYAEIYSKNHVLIDGLDRVHVGTDSYEIDVIDGTGFRLLYIDNQLFLVDTTGFKSNVPFYYNNKELSTKEYVQQREAYLQAQIDASGLTPSDIADNLTTNDSTKVLSAAQGVVLKGFIDSINTLLQCDDTTLDEIQEIVDYIKNNKSLIDGITTSKVSVSDIINNLTSTATNKPLSAAQGKALKDTLDSVQASISALTTNKQDKIDSSHKLDADLVAENSSRVFVTPTQKQQIGTNASDISSLDGRVTNLENNMPSAVSGTNDGTNWTSITIGNDTYAIPSGSSGGSGSGETLKIIEFRDAFTNADPLQVGMTSSNWTLLLSLLSQGMGITITEDNIQTVWTNGSDYEKMTFIKYVLLMKSFATFGVITVLTANTTETTVDGVDIVTSIDLIGGGTGSSPNYDNGVCASNLSDMSNALLYITTIGGGNGGNGGSSASSGAYYEIKTSDIAFYDGNDNQETNGVLTNLKIAMTEAQFEAFKEFINPQLTQEGLPTITDINSLVSLMNQVSTSSQTDSQLIAVAILSMSGFANYYTIENNGTLYAELVVSLGGLRSLTTQNRYGLIGLDETVKLIATWTLSQYGTSGGGSSTSNGETLVSITLTNLDVRNMDSSEELLYDMHIYCTKTRWDSFVALANTAFGYNITYENVGTFFTNANTQGQIMLIGYLLMDNFDKKMLPQSYICKQTTLGGVSTTDYKIFAGADSFVQDGVEFLWDLRFTGFAGNVDIDNVDRSQTPYATSNTTVTATEFTSAIGVGSSSSSESYYKIELTDYNVADTIEEKLILMLEPSDFNAVLTEINTQMGTSLSTPQDLITFYDSVKGNSTYYGGCCLLFATMSELCVRNNTNAVFVDYDVHGYNKITLAISSPIPMVKSDDLLVIGGLNVDNNTSITFTSSSTLTITEQTNQKL